ncbi:hypothetical protein N7486_003261 [Penicillium sp. IBT 16267x]|nr:hypothetical protein N7486_003261 [Penicillium sp. IBT 16267x]
MASLLRPRLTRYTPRAIRIIRPLHSVHADPINVWLYFDGPLSALKDQTIVILDILGGGFITIGPRRLKVPILSINYKKALEFAYPYILYKCYDVYHIIMSTNGCYLRLSGVTRPRIVVTGESAGGNLAKGEDMLPRLDSLVLVYPALNVRVKSWMTNELDYNHEVVASENKTSKALRDKIKKSENLSKDAVPPPEDQSQPLKTRLAISLIISYVYDRILTPEMMRAMIILYIGPHHRPDFNTDFYLSPVLAPDSLLAAFPKTYILTGDRDPLVDDTVIFAGRLRQAKLHQFKERQDLGLEKSRREFNEKDHVEVSLIPGVSHGFMQMAGFFPDAWKYINRSASWIENILDTMDLGGSEYSLLQASQVSGVRTSARWTGSSKSNGSARNFFSNHHRRFTGESSADEDRPLEMSMSKLTASSYNDDQPPASSSRRRRRRSRSSFASSRVTGFTSTQHESSEAKDFLAKLKRLDLDSDDHDGINSAPESPGVPRPRGRSIASLDSEEDILDRRMNGIAGGLMGLGERAQTPGP